MRGDRRRILIAGAGEAGRMVAAEIGLHGEFGAVVAGFIDDDPLLKGASVASEPVLGSTAQLEEVVRENGIDEVIIAVPTAPGRFVRSMIRRCGKAGVPYKIVPGVMEIIKGEVRIDQIREVRVEDLLGRETVAFDIESARKSFAGKRILVTGAGGSIGSELCRQLARVDPAELVLLGRGENRIFDIEDELKSSHPGLRLRTVIANLVDAPRTDRLTKELAPQIVFHAAAHKHVHYMERDPEEAVINNVGGSVNMIDASARHGVEKFVFISTDKAADPNGVMGASKRIVEIYLQAMEPGPCRFMTVRFGNVIGSAGSVVPLFIRQIGRGGPVTVSDPEATRYFMTVKEAAFLVIRSAIIGAGGETFILDMGEAVNIYEMARDIIILTGHEPGDEIPLEITGLREGEKLHETLAGRAERLVPSADGRIFLAKQASGAPPDLKARIAGMMAAAKEGRRGDLILAMSGIIPGFAARGESNR